MPCIIRLHERPAYWEPAAQWFHQRWNVPLEAYRESMRACISGKSPVPAWYLCLEGTNIIGGLGVIENDFHLRKDLTPNLCALYVDPPYRNQGIAGRLLEQVCLDMRMQGIQTLYLLTDHTHFYERYGWEFLCMVEEEGGRGESRLYVHR